MKKNTLVEEIFIRLFIAIAAIFITFLIFYGLAYFVMQAAVAAVFEVTQSIPSEQAYLNILVSEDINEVIKEASCLIAGLPTLIVLIQRGIELYRFINNRLGLSNPQKSFSPKPSFKEIQQRKEQADEREYQEVLQRMPYKKKYVLTDPEKLLWKILKRYIPKDEYVIAKPGIKEFVRTLDYNSSAINQRAWREIAQKHVDFLVCNAYSLYPLYAIEYDGDTHDSNNPANAATIRSDDFKDRLFSEIGLPLLRIEYGPEDYVKFQVEEALKKIYNPIDKKTSSTHHQNSQANVQVSEDKNKDASSFQKPTGAGISSKLDLTRKKVWTTEDPEMQVLMRAIEAKAKFEDKKQDRGGTTK